MSSNILNLRFGNSKSKKAGKLIWVSPHLSVVRKPIVEPLAAWQWTVFHVALAFPSAMTEL
jgi:hypothetical protein